MQKLKHFDYFEELLTIQENELVKEAINEGRVPIGYTCSYIPQAALMIDKCFPVRLSANNLLDTEEATYFLSAMLCSYSRSILQATLDGEYNFLGALMGTTSCGHMCGAVENVEYQNILGSDFTIPVIDVPKSKYHDHPIEGARTQYIEKLYEPLQKKFGISFTQETLRQAIKDYNDFADIMIKISDLRKLDKPKITGSEFHVIYQATQVVPKDKILSKLEETYEELLQRDGFTDYKAKIMLLGSELDDPNFTKIIEEEGGLVVADRYCTGSLPFLKKVEIGDGDVLFELLKFQMLNQQCPKVIDDTFNRMNYSVDQYEEFNADGIIYERMKFCQYWAYESVTVQKELRGLNIPLVIIEREYSLAAAGQIRTRIQAFIESLEIKRINKKMGGVS